MEQERIPTMPQVERIPTMPQSERVPTMPQSARVATIPQIHTATTVKNRKLLAEDVQFCTQQGGEFTLCAQRMISDDSGESQIYECCDASGTLYAAKVLTTVTPQSPPEKLEARQKVLAFLLSRSGDSESHILPLVDHGQVTVGKGEYFVEIYPFCPDGDLGRRSGTISYATLKEEIIPALNEALHTFHAAGFVHRDIKPDNLYYHEGRVVLGDFGITCEVRADGFATDRTKTGTLGYYAPELMSQAALTASDYYSMGQTLWTLYSGRMMYGDILQRYKNIGAEEQRNQVNFAMLNNIYYGLDAIRPQEIFFETLILGLLQYAPGERFGYEEVKRWLSGDKTLSRGVANREKTAVFPVAFLFNEQECWDNYALFNIVSKNWETGKNLLYSGTFKRFYAAFDHGMAGEIDRIIKEYSTVEHGSDAAIEQANDAGLGQLLLQLNHYECLVWRGRLFYDFSAIADAAETDEEDTRRDVTELLATGLVGTWYKAACSVHEAEIDPQMVSAIEDIRRFAGSGNEGMEAAARSIACALFSTRPDARMLEGCSDISELARRATGRGKDCCTYLLELIDGSALYGFLYAQGCGEPARYLLENRANPLHDVEAMFDLFAAASAAAQQEELAACYLRFGPWSHLLWLRENLALYAFRGEAETVKTELEQCAVEGESVAAVREAYRRLSVVAAKFRAAFCGNVFLARLGLFDGKDENGITSTHLKAYWYGEYLGQEVPLGFACAFDAEEVQ